MKSKLQLVVLSLCLSSAVPGWAVSEPLKTMSSKTTVASEAKPVFRQSGPEPASFSRVIPSRHSYIAPINTRDHTELPSGGSSNLYLALFILLFAVASRALKQ